MKIKAHQTFPIRMGWLYKGLSNVINDTKENEYSDLFISENSMNRLGLGSNMVKSLRYWMVVTGLTSEKLSKGQKPTFFGKLVYDFDKHFEKIGTLLLCHYFLATDKEWGTSWYYFFNEYNSKEFLKNDLVLEATSWIHSIKENVSENSINSDIDCIIKSYSNFNTIYQDENIYEDNKICPFSQLGLILQSTENSNIYFKNSIQIEEFPLEIAMFVILKQMEFTKVKSLNLDSLLLKPTSISKVFNFNTEDLIKLISKLEMKNYIRYVKTAGLEQIILIDDSKQSTDYLKNYYMRAKDEK